MVPTDTHGRGGCMGDRCVTLTWSRVVDGRPDWPSDRCRRHRRNVWCGCSSLSTYCSKAHGSTSVGTIFAHEFTRPSVRGRRRSHPTRSGRPRDVRPQMIRGPAQGRACTSFFARLTAPLGPELLWKVSPRPDQYALEKASARPSIRPITEDRVLHSKRA